MLIQSTQHGTHSHQQSSRVSALRVSGRSLCYPAFLPWRPRRHNHLDCLNKNKGSFFLQKFSLRGRLSGNAIMSFLGFLLLMFSNSLSTNLTLCHPGKVSGQHPLPWMQRRSPLLLRPGFQVKQYWDLLGSEQRDTGLFEASSGMF